MVETLVLRDLVVLLAASLPIAFLAQTARLPPVVGFLVAGVLIGPSAAGLIRSTETVAVLAEVGVVLLLFSIGLEFSLAQMARIGRTMLGTGSLQVVLTTAAIAGVAVAAGRPLPHALAIGFVGTLSSTAIVLTLLVTRGEIDAPHGRLGLGLLLFQDLCVVPMMLLLPVLSRPAELNVGAVALALGRAVLAVGLILAAARIALPRLLRQVVRLRNRELFVGTIVLFCLGAAWGAAQLGLSLAIGAFVAGLVISESEYSHQVVAEVLPFRDLFNSVFFMSMGMLVDVGFLATHLPAVAGVALAIMAVKAVLGAGAVLPFQPSPRVALVVGLLIAQVGEFSFVLAGEAARLGIFTAAELQSILAVSGFTMVVSAAVIAVAPSAVLRMFAARPAPGAGATAAAIGTHVLVVGYGLNGRNLARVLRETGVSYRIVELNADRVCAAREAGEPIEFGDATRPVILERVGADTAAAIVVAISDAVATRRIVSLARQLNPHAPLIVRTRHVVELEDLYRLGADEVIPEEFETSVEIFARVLRRMHVPSNIITLQVDLIRGERYAAMRGTTLPRQHLGDLRAVLEASTTETYLLREGSPAAGATVRGIDLRERSGATIIAVVRDGRAITNPPPDFGLQAGDVLVLLGSHAELAAAMRLLDPPAVG